MTLDTYLIIAVAVLLGQAIIGWLVIRKPKPGFPDISCQLEMLAMLRKLLDLALAAPVKQDTLPAALPAPPGRPRQADGPTMVEILKVHHDGTHTHHGWARKGTQYHLDHCENPHFHVKGDTP